MFILRSRLISILGISLVKSYGITCLSSLYAGGHMVVNSPWHTKILRACCGCTLLQLCVGRCACTRTWSLECDCNHESLRIHHLRYSISCNFPNLLGRYSTMTVLTSKLVVVYMCTIALYDCNSLILNGLDVTILLSA